MQASSPATRLTVRHARPLSDMPDVVIVASAFGLDAIRRDGHVYWARHAAQAGARGFEVRRELFADDAHAAPPALRDLGAALAGLSLWSVYSTPATLYTSDGALDTAALALAVDEAAALGARLLKFQLGGFRPGRAADGARIAACLRGSGARLLVENGQLPEGGALAQFTGLFDALEREGHAGLLGMTFDTGNWQWPGVVALDAARWLAAYVEYIHCKAVSGEGARRFAIAPAADDAQFAALLAALPRNVPRGIEFPFDAQRLTADASHYTGWLAAA